MDKTRNVISRLKSVWQAAKNPTEEELARNDRNYSVAGTARRPSQWQEQVHEPSQQLEEFRLLVGINQDRSFKAPHGFNPNKRPIVSTSSRSAPNLGIYTTVTDSEIKCKRSFKHFSRLINTCLGLQIVVAAALTAIGAANGNHSAVTVFGAINTIIAGFLTYLKGSGLPNRLKYFQHEWGKVREYIEQRERDIICGQIDVNIYEEVERIRKMYESVKADIEANIPDRFVSASNLRREPHTTEPGPPLARPLAESNKLASDTSSDPLRFSYLNTEAQKAKGNVTDRAKEVGDMEKRLNSFGLDFLHDRRADANAATEKGVHFGSNILGGLHDLKSKLEDKKKEISSLEREIESHGQRMADEKRGESQNAANKVTQQGADLQADAARTMSGNIAHGQQAAGAAISQQQEAARDAFSHGRDTARGEAHEFLDKAFESPKAVGPKNDE